jgi:hypothetical protein
MELWEVSLCCPAPFVVKMKEMWLDASESVAVLNLFSPAEWGWHFIVNVAQELVIVAWIPFRTDPNDHGRGSNRR